VIPSLGATGGEVVIDGWLTQPGEQVKAGSALFTVTTDKATVEVEAFRDGFLRAVLSPAGATASPGSIVGLLADSPDEPLGDIQAPPPAPAAEIATKPAAESPKPTVTPPAARARQAAGETLPRALTTERLLDMYSRMVLIRRFEDYLYQLFLQGIVPGTLHQYQGQEAVAVGVCSALRNDDLIFSTHRPVGHVLAKGSSPRGIAAEIWGKSTGCAGGKCGQMHLTDLSVGAMPSNAIVGANIPIATGAALAFKLSGVDRVAVSFFGDGASNIGAFHEGINLAAVKQAPVIFVCENNQYAASTHISLTSRVTDIAQRAAAYGIPGHTHDGMDIVGVYESAWDAVQRARRGEGPTLLEYKTYRYSGHSRGDPGGYRTKDEVKEWKGRDPIARFRRLLIQEYGQPAQRLDDIERERQAEVEEAVSFARSSPEPDAAECYAHVWAGEEASR
ncbi:MAG: thiamine pyrophosphate-dependent enzyme, partial [Rudaea sp.]